MARSRNIKPGIFKNEVFGVADPLFTLAFEGLWLIADRDGRLEDRPLRIKAEIFPYRNIDIEQILGWLSDNKFIIRYQYGENRYIQVTNFSKHQNPHKNEIASIIPEYSIGCTATDKIGTSSDKIGTTPADSLSLDSFNLIPDSLQVLQGTSALPPPREKVPFEEIVALYHEVLPELPVVQKLTDARKGYIRQRWKEDLPDLLHWKNYFLFVKKSKFLTGKAEGQQGRPPFRADIEWLCKPANFTKISEDKYHGK